MPKSQSSPSTVLLLLILVFGGAVLVGQVRSRPNTPLPAPLPTTNVEGWLNVAEPLVSDDLSGRWVVVDLWATWCPPCVASLPELAEFRERWPEDKVLLIGIADDDSSAMGELRRTIDAVDGFTWPVAYGGRQAIGEFGSQIMLPTLVLYDPAGAEVARAHRITELETLIDP